VIGKPQIHPMFQIILDNWSLYGCPPEKKPAKANTASDMAEKKAKNTYTFPRRVEKKTKHETEC